MRRGFHFDNTCALCSSVEEFGTAPPQRLRFTCGCCYFSVDVVIQRRFSRFTQCAAIRGPVVRWTVGLGWIGCGSIGFASWDRRRRDVDHQLLPGSSPTEVNITRNKNLKTNAAKEQPVALCSRVEAKEELDQTGLLGWTLVKCLSRNWRQSRPLYRLDKMNLNWSSSV